MREQDADRDASVLLKIGWRVMPAHAGCNTSRCTARPRRIVRVAARVGQPIRTSPATGFRFAQTAQIRHPNCTVSTSITIHDLPPLERAQSRRRGRSIVRASPGPRLRVAGRCACMLGSARCHRRMRHRL